MFFFLKIRFGEWDESLRYKVSQFGKSDGTVEGLSDFELIEILSTRSAGGILIEQAVNAHEIGVLVACLKKDRVKMYNCQGLQSASQDDLRLFFSFDKNSKDNSLVRSPDNPRLDHRLDIPSQLQLAKGCPVRNLRAIEATSGDATTIIPKYSFGTFQNENFDVNDPTKSTAHVQFQIGKKFWFSDVKFAFEEFDRAELNTSDFKSFFENFSHRFFMPLEVAYSVTMTSLQGREFDNLIFDLYDIGSWIRHVLYMGLTRVRTSKGIRCLNIPPSTDCMFNKTDHEIVQLYTQLEEISKYQLSSESDRNESFLTMDFVELLEKFKVLSFYQFI